jgi:hypothetical protein
MPRSSARNRAKRGPDPARVIARRRPFRYRLAVAESESVPMLARALDLLTVAIFEEIRRPSETGARVGEGGHAILADAKRRVDHRPSSESTSIERSCSRVVLAAHDDDMADRESGCDAASAPFEPQNGLASCRDLRRARLYGGRSQSGREQAYAAHRANRRHGVEHRILHM